MQKYNVMLAAASMLLVGASCASHYQLASVDRSRLLIDRRYDATPDAAAATFIMPYRHEVDSVMRPVVPTLQSVGRHPLVVRPPV